MRTYPSVVGASPSSAPVRPKSAARVAMKRPLSACTRLTASEIRSPDTRWTVPVSSSPRRFYRALRRDGREHGLILVMLFLHMLPRFTGTPLVTRTVADLTGRAPMGSAQFVAEHRDELLSASARS